MIPTNVAIVYLASFILGMAIGMSTCPFLNIFEL